MSAFVVCYETINNILSSSLNTDQFKYGAFVKSDLIHLIGVDDTKIYDNLTILGKDFLRLNVQSVVERYKVDKNSEEYKDYVRLIDNYQFHYQNVSIAQSIKSLLCLIYQSCEIENCNTNFIFHKMKKMKEILTMAFIESTKEYQNAEWG